MNPSALPLRDLAERLLEEECDRGDGLKGPAALRVCDKLGSTLSKLAGAAGYRSLLSRALALAQADAAVLGAVHVAPDGTLQGLADLQGIRSSEEFTRGEVALVAQLLGLLHTFIGEQLTHQLVQDAWPAIVHTSSASPTP